MRYVVQTFGCQMNAHDSRRIEEVLGQAGWEPTDDAALADLVLFNTCSVREKAEQKLLSVLGSVRHMKEQRPDLVIAVAGCVAQQEGDKLLGRAAHLDLVLGPDNIPELPALVKHVQDGGPPLSRTVFDLDAPAFLSAKPRSGDDREVTAFVTTMKGCDERCTFCIVPTTRGPERYRSADDVVQEIAGMVAGGTREVTLLGQTVNSWHSPRTVAEGVDAPSEFPALLRRIAAEVPDLRRLRYTSPHPRHLTPELIAAHAELAVLPAHVHLPVQSGSDRMLRRMLRRYTRAEYVARVTALREAVRVARDEQLTLSSDFIVGFPGETPEDFEQTLSLVREVGFSASFAFKYSPRPHTPALKLGDDVTAEEKDERLARLLEVIGEQQAAHLATLVGSRATVLIESTSKTPASEGPADPTVTRWRGRTERHEIVHVDVPKDRAPVGHFVSVEIAQANAHSLIGRLKSDPSSLPRASTTPAAPPRTGAIKLPILGAASR